MDKKKTQTMRISDLELELIKSLFADNEALLFIIRKVFIQADITEEESKLIEQSFKTDEVHKMMRKVFLPEIDTDVPLGQNIDLWMTIDLKDKNPDELFTHLIAREKVIAFIEEGLSRLKIPVKAGTDKLIKFSIAEEKAKAEETYINLLARNTVINHVDQQLIQIKLLAGQKTETIEQTKSRLQKDSTK